MSVVLLVEDDDDIRAMATALLADSGHDVCPVQTGEEAVRSARAEPPDLVLLDINLVGDLSGLDVARELRRAPATRRVPILMLTAHGTDADVEAGFSAGASDYLTKPFGASEMLHRVGALLDQPDA